MRILYVITSLRLGGAERLVTDLSKGLTKVGHKVDIFVMDSTPTPLTKELEDSGVKIYTGWEGYFHMWNPLCIFKLGSVVSKGHYDIVHSHNSAAQYIAAFFSKKSILVTTEHTPKNKRRKISFLKKIDSYVYSRYKKIISVSHSTRDALLKYHLDDTISGKTLVIYNGINLYNFKNVINGSSQNKKEIKIIMVAGFHYPKDQATLIKAMTILPDDYKLWLVGDGITRKESEQLAGKLGVSSRVKFWGFRKDVPELLKQADIFVLSTRYEGFGIAAIEAMAMGLPVIASDVEGLSEIVASDGVLFKAGDYKELVEKIKKISKDENLYKEIADKCKERSKDFDIHKVIRLHETLYKDLIEESKPKSV